MAGKDRAFLDNCPRSLRMTVNRGRVTGGVARHILLSSLSEEIIRLAHRIDRSASGSFRPEVDYAPT